MKRKIIYNPETGEARWSSGEAVGWICKTRQKDSGYIRFYHNGKRWPLHRYVWQMYNGPIPKNCVIDHINGDPLDNRLVNLRMATKTQNRYNSRSWGESGFRCVTPRKNSVGEIINWMVEIEKGGKRYRKGGFKTKQDAAKHYNSVAPDWFGEFTRFNQLVV